MRRICYKCGIVKTVRPSAIAYPNDPNKYRCGDCTKKHHRIATPDWSMQKKLKEFAQKNEV